jgi:transcriptional regulator with XRE-family HTH domain
MFGEDLKQLMKAKKITSRELATQIGVTETYISYLITGKKAPSFRTMNRIADYLGISVTELFPEKKEPPVDNDLAVLAKKYESVIRALDSMRPELVAELSERIEAAAGLFPRMDATEKQSQDGASYLRKKKPG